MWNLYSLPSLSSSSFLLDTCPGGPEFLGVFVLPAVFQELGDEGPTYPGVGW